MTRLGGTKRVQRLGIIAHHRDARICATQPRQDVDLKLVDVLILVDQHVVEGAGDARAEAVVLHRCAPEEQQIIQVDQAGGSFAPHIGSADVRDRVDAVRRPWGDLGDDGRERPSGVDRRRVQVDQERLAREPTLR